MISILVTNRWLTAQPCSRSQKLVEVQQGWQRTARLPGETQTHKLWSHLENFVATWKTWKTLKTFLFSLYEIGSVVSSPGPEPDPPIWKIYDGICKQDRKVHGMEIEWVSFILHTNELWLHPEEGLLVLKVKMIFRCTNIFHLDTCKLVRIFPFYVHVHIIS